MAIQCLQLLKPLSLSVFQLQQLNSIIETEARNDIAGTAAAKTAAQERLSAVQAKLNKLTTAYLDGIIDQTSYEIAKETAIMEKTELKSKIGSIDRTASTVWFEPVQHVVKALELARSLQAQPSNAEIAALVKQVGTNHQITGKNVSFTFSEPYQSTASLLANCNKQIALNPSLTHDKNWSYTNGLCSPV